MDLFIQVKSAYDVLNDPQKRAIYDVVGMKGIKAEGWEVSEMKILPSNTWNFSRIGYDSNENSTRNSR